MNQSPKKIILVLGMHRSGTSAVTRALSTMGVDLGNRLMPAVSDVNAKGFWEDMDINELNEEILSELHSNWYHLKSLTVEELDTLQHKGFFLRAVELLRRKIANTDIFGIKNPRMAKLLPFWDQVFAHCGVETLYLLALRNPLSVAKSLEKRDKMEPERSYYLWIEHLLGSLPPIIEKNGLVVDYDRLIDSPRAEIERISKHFSLPIQEDSLVEYEQEFVDQSLRHAAYKTEDLALDNACPPLANEIYLQVLKCASGSTSSAPHLTAQQLTQWQGELKRMQSLFTLTDSLVDTLRETAHNLFVRDDQFKHISQVASDREAHIHDLIAGIEDLREAITRHEQISAEQHSTILEKHKEVVELEATCTTQQLDIAHFKQSIADKDQHISNLETINATEIRIKENLRNEVSALQQSTSWKLTRPLRWAGLQVKRVRRVLSLIPPAVHASGGVVPFIKKITRTLFRFGLPGIRRGLYATQTLADCPPGQPTPLETEKNTYSQWIQSYDTLTEDVRQTMTAHLETLKQLPVISVVMPTYNPKPEWLKEAIESVRNQIYPHWELCIADDVSTNPEIFPILQNYATEDSRIKVIRREKNGHISAASNTALELATGDWVALLDHDDILPAHALFWVADTINAHPDAQLIYSDEDKINEKYERFEPYFKCDWNLDLFYSQNMFSHLGVYKTELARKVNGFRVGLEGSQDHDLALRCMELVKPEQIHHIPRILYHWRVHAESTASSSDAKPYAAIAGERALNEHFERMNIDAKAKHIGYGYRVTYPLPPTPPLVSLIIPTRNGLALLRQCIDSIQRKTSYKNYEIIIIDNGSDDEETLQYMANIGKKKNIRVVRDDRPFNYSALNNAAVKLAQGELIGLINNDIEVIDADWLSEMVSHALRPGIGAVGAKLLYPDNRVQHAGVLLGLGPTENGVAGHAHHEFIADALGYFGRAALTQSLSAVTAACLVIRKSTYEKVQGLNETDLSVAFNDVDFCLRVRQAGYRNLWTPFARLYHHESATRGSEDTPKKIARFTSEVNYMLNTWGPLLKRDPAYSPNLVLNSSDFSLAWPPRISQLPERGTAS